MTAVLGQYWLFVLKKPIMATKTMWIWSIKFKFSARNPGDQKYIGHNCIWIKFFNFKETVHARTYLPFLVHLRCVCFHPHCMENPFPETTLYHNPLQDNARHNLLYLQRIMTAKTFLWGTESMTKASDYFLRNIATLI